MNVRIGIAVGLVVLATGACGRGSTTATVDDSPAATPTMSPAASPAAGFTTAQPTAGTGRATVVGTTTPGSPPASSPPATVRPTASTTTVTDDASGSTVVLHVGQRLQVRLTQGTYDPPVASNDVLVRRSASGGYPTAQPVEAVFEAVRTGAADITATSDAACFHSESRCLMPTRIWVLHVKVTSSPPS